jgi:hypothetical protein
MPSPCAFDRCNQRPAGTRDQGGPAGVGKGFGDFDGAALDPTGDKGWEYLQDDGAVG